MEICVKPRVLKAINRQNDNTFSKTNLNTGIGSKEQFYGKFL